MVVPQVMAHDMATGEGKTGVEVKYRLNIMDKWVTLRPLIVQTSYTKLTTRLMRTSINHSSKLFEILRKASRKKPRRHMKRQLMRPTGPWFKGSLNADSTKWPHPPKIPGTEGGAE
jgi:hypothetical protein